MPWVTASTLQVVLGEHGAGSSLTEASLGPAWAERGRALISLTCCPLQLTTGLRTA